MSESPVRRGFTLCAPHCGNYPCSFEVEAEGGAVRAFRAHPKMRFKPCIKGFQIPGRYAHPDRLLHPLKRVGPKGSGPGGANRFERVSWEEALGLVAEGLEAAKEKGGNESVLMYHYASQHSLPGGTNAAAATILRLMNLWGGAVPAYQRGSLCWRGYLGGSQDVFGSWQVRLRASADCAWIVIWGNNPVETAYRGLLQSLLAARRGGTRFIVVDPMRTKTVERLGARHVPVRPSTDTALALAVLRLLLAGGGTDAAALRERTNAPFLVGDADGRFLTAADGRPLAWDEAAGEARPFDVCERPALEGRFRAGGIPCRGAPSGEPLGVPCRPALERLREAAEPWTPARAARECGVSEEDVRALAEAVAGGKVIVYYGSYQRTLHGEQAVRALHILNLLAGAFEGIVRHGAEGGGFHPDRATDSGLGRVMADRWAVPNPVARRIPVGQVAEAVLNPASHGGPVHAALVMWGNPVGQGGDAHKSERALRALDFCAVADLFMTPTARCADVVLPASTWLERCALVEGVETGMTFYYLIPDLAPRHLLMFTPGVMPPRGESLDDFDIVCRLAARMGYGASFPWRSSREWIEELIDAARRDARFPWFGEVTMERLEAEGMVTLEVPPGAVSLEPRTPHGRAQVYLEGRENPVPVHLPSEGDGRHPLQLIAPKTYFRASSTFNNATGLLRHGFNVATLHPDDAAPRGIAEGQRVALFNGYGRAEFTARVSEAIRPGVVHVPAGGDDALGFANRLTGDGLSEYENAAFNSYRVEAEPAGGA